MKLTTFLSVAGTLVAMAVSPAFSVVAPPNTPADFTGNWTGDDWSMNTVGVFQWMAGSAVAISPHQFLTASHLNSGIGQGYSVNGVSVTVLNVQHPPGVPGIALVTVDAALPVAQWEQMYNGAYTSAHQYTGAYASVPAAIMIGFGISGATYPSYYTWDYATGQKERWGTSRIQSPLPLGDGTMGFSMPYNGASDSATQYEAGLANHDSGGGTFVKVGDCWQLAGINLSVSPGGQGYATSYAGDVSYAYSWIIDNTTIPGDADMDLKVTFKDYLALESGFGKSGATWYNGDFNHDGKVDFKDYLLIQDNFGKSALLAGTTNLESPATLGSPADPLVSNVPDPATLALLISGAPILLRRFPRRRI